jgi:hypothetical protein
MEFVENERSDMLSFYWKDKLWFRGKNQRQRAISERQRLYNTKGVVISKNETNSNSQTSTVFENPSELYDYIQTTPQKIRCFYEIIEHNSKLYFDIEYQNYSLDLTDVLQHLYCILKLLYNIYPKKRIILSAHRFNKKSWHIIFPEYSISPEERKILSKYLKHSAKPYVDWRVYNNNQPLRLCGCYKPNDFCSKLHLNDDNEDVIFDYDSNTFVYTMVTQILPDSIPLKSKYSEY